MTKITLILILIIMAIVIGMVHGTLERTDQAGSYYKTLHDYYYNYHKFGKVYKKWTRGRVTWPKKNGRCSHSPWKIDGINPVMEEAKRGNIVLMLALKPDSKYSKHQLDYFNDLASYYK